MIPIYKPFLPKNILKYAHNALDSSWISNLGEYKELSSNILSSLLQCHSTLVSNGTTSTHLIYKSLKYKNNNIKNIIVPSNVYVAAWNSMLFDGDDINLIPVKTNIKTWNADIEDIIFEAKKRDPKDTAILIVHNLGGIINVPQLKRELPEYFFIEDNCEGFLGKYENKFSGTESLASSISFYGNKTITCGEGGAIVFNDPDLCNFIEKIHSQGQTKTRYIHDTLGYNYRMTNIQAAILYGQLLNKDVILEKKKKIFDRYKKKLIDNKNVVFQHQEENCQNALWMFSIRLLGNKSFAQANEFFKNNKIEIRNIFYPMSYHEHLRQFSNSEKEKECEVLLKEVIMLPSSPNLKIKEIHYICEKINEYCKLYL